MRRILVMAGVAAAAAVAGGQAPIAARPTPAPAAANVDSRAVVAEIRKILAENYVLPDKRAALDSALAKGLAEGRYNVAEPSVLAERINADMAAVAHDKHLGLSYAPEQAARLGSIPQADDAPPTPDQIRGAARRNHGIVELKLLPGNIRYMDLQGFVWAGAPSAEAYDNAMRFLRGGDAVIIDLRSNGGGSPEAVQYLVSHFMKPDRHIVTFHMGPTKVDRLSTLKELPAGRMVGKPLYILTSGNSASAAEEFIGHVAGFKLGEVIGENSAGAGFRNQFFPVPGGFLLSVSVGRAVLASTGKDWEGVGIAPTVATEREKALDVARMHALQRLAGASTEPREKSQLEAMAAMLSAKLNPVTPALPLSAYAGTFGERVLRIEDGKLIYQRTGGGKLTLVPVGPNIFTFEEDPLAKVIFSVAGNQASGFELVRGDGSRVPVQRSN